MPVIEGGQVLRGGQDFGGVLGGQVLYGGQEIEPEQGGRTQPDSEAVEMSVGPFRRSGAPPNGWYNGVADKGAIAVDIATGTRYINTGTKAATVWTADAASGGGSGELWTPWIVLTTADLLALHSTPKVLVDAPAAEETILPTSLVLDMQGGSTPYNVPLSTYFYVGHGATDNGPWNTGYFSFQANNMLVISTNRVLRAFHLGNAGDGTFNVTFPVFPNMVGQPLACQIDPTHPLTDGDGALRVRVGYLVV